MSAAIDTVAPPLVRDAVAGASVTASNGGPVVRTVGLTKRYGGRTVVDSLDLEVPRGVVAGFLGPNGAGKTTTLRMLLGLARPSGGTGEVLGAPLDRAAAYLPKVGALIESPAFYPALSGERNLAVQAALSRIDRRRISVVLDRVGLGDRGADAYRTYSLGMKQRLGIAAALLGEPDLLVLDEPTNGLDPAGIRSMRELLRSLAADGPTVLVSSHLLAEVQQMCDWLVVVENGRRIYQGVTADLLSGARAELIVRSSRSADLPVLAEIAGAQGFPVEQGADRVRVGITGASAGDVDAVAGVINRAALDRGLILVELSIHRETLEDRYLELVEERAA